MNDDFNIRRILKDEIPLLAAMIKEMSEFEKLASEVDINEEVLASEILIKKRAEAFIIGSADRAAGYCIYFYNFSSFMGRPGLYIEDIYIRPEYRGKGFGRKAFSFLEQIAKDEGCARMEWACLDWNSRAIDFYEKNGGVPMKDWTIFRKKLI